MPWVEKVTDNFNRADENPLGNGVWTTITGWNPMQVLTNAARKTVEAALNGSYYSGGAAFLNNQYAQAVRNGEGFIGLLIRINGGNNGYMLSVEDNTNVGYFYRIDAGVQTQLGASFAYNAVNGDTLRLEAIGSDISAYSNGVLLATRNDATYASGRPGIHQYNNIAYLEDFSAGEDVVASRFAGFVS